MDPKIINEFLLKNNIEGGLDVSKNKQNLLMFAVTELNTPEEINRTIEILKKV
jgi:glycine cleavage system pyridoxal-binding protein P